VIAAIIQARLGSSRLPGKVLKEINGRPMLSYMLERVSASNGVDKVVVATSVAPDDDHIVEFCKKEKILYYRGSLEDVLDRYYQTAKKINCDVVVRVTADCPLIDPQVIDTIIDVYKGNTYDYVANTSPPEGFTFPEGMDTEVFSFEALRKAWLEAKKPSEREHVTFYFWQNPQLFSIFRYDLSENLSGYRLTVDYPEDFEVIESLITNLYSRKQSFVITMKDIITFLDIHPEIKGRNSGFLPNKGWQSSFAKDKKAGF
jgi:spore coat polysaccharide biosynthesis protein SpsF